MTDSMLSNALGGGGRGYHDALTGAYFVLEVNGGEIPFREVSGLSTEIQVVETHTSGPGGNFKGRENYLGMGTWKWEDITIKRPLDHNSLFFNWASRVLMNGAATERTTCSIRLYDSAGVLRVSWTCLQVWPKKYTGSQVNASSGSEAITEEIVLCHEGLYLDAMPGTATETGYINSSLV